jgi:20S proteasome subunit alpha 5
VAVRTPEGVVFAVEKRVTSSLLEQHSIEKVFEVDTHLGVATSGLAADARTLVDRMRVDAQNHRFTYDEPLRPESLMASLSDVMIAFGEGEGDDDDDDKKEARMGRPFGASLLLAGLDRADPQLWCIDPSGTYVRYAAHAIGSGSEGARTLLQERYRRDLSLAEAETLVLRVVAETMEEKVTPANVEVAVVTPAGGYARVAAERVAAGIARAEEVRRREEGAAGGAVGAAAARK